MLSNVLAEVEPAAAAVGRELCRPDRLLRDPTMPQNYILYKIHYTDTKWHTVDTQDILFTLTLTSAYKQIAMHK